MKKSLKGIFIFLLALIGAVFARQCGKSLTKSFVSTKSESEFAEILASKDVYIEELRQGLYDFDEKWKDPNNEEILNRYLNCFWENFSSILIDAKERNISLKKGDGTKFGKKAKDECLYILEKIHGYDLTNQISTRHHNYERKTPQNTKDAKNSLKDYEYPEYLNQEEIHKLFPLQLDNQYEHFNHLLQKIDHRLIKIDSNNFKEYDFQKNPERTYLKLQGFREIYSKGSNYLFVSTNILPKPISGTTPDNIFWATVVNGIDGFVIYKDNQLISKNFHVSNSGRMGCNSTDLNKLKVISNDCSGRLFQVGNRLFLHIDLYNQLYGVIIESVVTEGEGFIDDPVVQKRIGVECFGNEIIADYLDLRDSSKFTRLFKFNSKIGTFE